jgi:hypothetical protein
VDGQTLESQPSPKSAVNDPVHARSDQNILAANLCGLKDSRKPGQWTTAKHRALLAVLHMHLSVSQPASPAASKISLPLQQFSDLPNN